MKYKIYYYNENGNISKYNCSNIASYLHRLQNFNGWKLANNSNCKIKLFVSKGNEGTNIDV